MARTNRKPRILIVEDDASVMKVFCALLTRSGYEIIEASYALPALFRVIRRPPDLILADLHMPIMSGLELIDQFKGHLETRDIPVVVVTGSDSAETRAEAFKAGCAGYITKPIDARTFPAQIAGFLQAAQRNERRHEDSRRPG